MNSPHFSSAPSIPQNETVVEPEQKKAVLKATNSLTGVLKYLELPEAAMKVTPQNIFESTTTHDSDKSGVKIRRRRLGIF